MYQLLSHNDLDGVGCGILARLAFREKVNVRYNSIASLNKEIEQFLDEDRKGICLLITDLSPNEENEEKLNEFYQVNGRVQLIDHHKTALHLNEYEWGSVVVEDEEGRLASATSLFYDYLISKGFLEKMDAVTEFVELVRQYDTWEWEQNENHQAHRLNTLFFLVSIEEFEDKMLERLQTAEHFDFDDLEKQLLKVEENKIDRYIRRKKRELVQKETDGKLAGVVYAESYHSELGNELGKAFPHLDFIVMLNIGSKRIALRTIHDHIDVSEIADYYGGGGHQKASGCSLSNEAYKRFVEDTFHLEPIREDAKWNRYNVKESSFGSLYKNSQGEVFFLYPNDQLWEIEKNKKKLEQSFNSFQEGELFLKRNEGAWLLRDEQFVAYLMDEVKR
ncbi:oligoribonuclease [Bacillus sp. AGMB 02131]|uniref:Oligoribonuclease n=1 Tax=Peribacillus faecalis TaxID=2772559 RepID=A0A927HAS5_9BACI|nr:oligoribonuclease [Peribacillus faecalis]MBD3107751.1 oligoribonuclease [Peribacillus faecalis]